MNLVIDIGNTKVKSALFHNREMVSNEIFDPLHSRILSLVKNHEGGILISSVISDNEWKISSEAGKIIILSHQLPIPLKNGYLSPETLGNDRLANAVAIHTLSQGKNALSVDCGTCLKFDLVINGTYEGGSISPGLNMRFQALHTFTDKLPLIDIEIFEKPNGKNTRESILSGCFRGMKAEIEKTIEEYEKMYGPLQIYLTGGDHKHFAGLLKNCIFADPFLTLKGLNEILLYQNK